MPTTTLHPGIEQTFSVSLTISLEYEERDAPQFALSRVEEVQPDRLWVAMPMRAAMFVPLPIGSTVAAHIKRDDAIYVLPGHVTGRRLQPVPMLEISPTGPIQRRQQREFVRLKLVLMPTSATLLHPNGSTERLAATVVNIGAGGALLRSRQPIAVGQRIALEVQFPGAIATLTTTVEVLRVDQRRADRGMFYELGCAFSDLTDADRDLITKFIFRFQSRQARGEAVTPQ